MANDVRLTEERLDSPEPARLVDAHYREMSGRYRSTNAEPDQLDALQFTPEVRGALYVAWRGDLAVGCGGLRRYDDSIGEVKRMYVESGARRTGIARVMLAAIEMRARELVYARLILETGTLQPEAIALYESSGYEQIPSYAKYADSELSRCFAKDL